MGEAGPLPGECGPAWSGEGDLLIPAGEAGKLPCGEPGPLPAGEAG